jgi:hypothetical protein
MEPMAVIPMSRTDRLVNRKWPPPFSAASDRHNFSDASIARECDSSSM